MDKTEIGIVCLVLLSIVCVVVVSCHSYRVGLRDGYWKAVRHWTEDDVL